MAGFDRTKVKATPMAVLKKQEEEYAKARPERGGDRDFTTHKIEEGTNIFRFFPPHPEGGGSSFGEARCVSYLTVKRPKRGEDKKIIEGEFEDKLFPIFNAKVHGGLTKDPVESYMDFAKNTAIPEFVGDDTEKGELIWKEIVGDFKSKLQGIKPKDGTEVYAMKKQKDGTWSKVGRLEFTKSVKQQLMDVAIEFSSGDDTTPDPFTDPDEGIAVIIENSGSGFDRYKVSLESKRDKLTQTFIPTPLTDEQGEEWMKLEPLYKLYVNSYKRSDFNMQVEGLKNFDDYLAKKKYPIQVFGYDAFLDTLAEIEAQLPEEIQDEKVNDELPFDTKDEPKEEIKKPAVPKTPIPLAKKLVAQPVATTSVSNANEKLAQLKAKFQRK